MCGRAEGAVPGLRGSALRRANLRALMPIALLAMLSTLARGDEPRAFEPGRLERVEALADPMLKGEIATYYTPGYERRAKALQRLLSGELRFSRRELHCGPPLTLAVLDKEQWGRAERQLPYPMPSVDGDPPVVLMPANWGEAEAFFPKRASASDRVIQAIGAHGLTWQEANHRAGDTIGGHEVGHAVIKACGVVAGTRWMNELLASYVLYAYLQRERGDLLWLVDDVLAGTDAGPPQQHVSLDDFESMYMQLLASEGANYDWYQREFLRQVKRVYKHQGIGFLRKVRTAFAGAQYEFAALGNAETLRRLDAIDPGFSAWAAALASLPRAPRLSTAQ